MSISGSELPPHMQAQTRGESCGCLYCDLGLSPTRDASGRKLHEGYRDGLLVASEPCRNLEPSYFGKVVDVSDIWPAKAVAP